MLAFLFAVVALANGKYHTTHLDDFPTVSHGHHIEHHERIPTSDAPRELPNAMNRTMELHFRTHKHVFSLNLHLFEGLYARDAAILSTDEHGNEIRLKPSFRSFHGQAVVTHLDGNDREFGRCSVTFYNDERFHAVIVTTKETYTVDPIGPKHTQEYPIHGRDRGHKMHVYLGSDTKSKHTYSERLSEMIGRFTSKLNTPKIHQVKENQPSEKDTLFNNFFVPSSSDEARSTFGMRSDFPGIQTATSSRGSQRKLQQLVKFDNCYPNQGQNVMSIKLGVVTDESFALRIRRVPGITTDQDVLRWLEQVVSDATSIIYLPQLNVYLQMSTTILSSAGRNNGYQRPCTVEPSPRLSSLADWRRTQQDSIGLWHLFTNCHPPAGTVGIAYISVVCNKRNGVGLTNYLRSTWETFAHEIGHNFAARHSFEEGQGATGGIMDYGPGYYPLQPVSARVYQFNPVYRKGEICSHLQRTMTMTQSCWEPFPPPNGTYQWEQTGTWDTSLCSNRCDRSNRYQRMTYKCFQLSANGLKKEVNRGYCETKVHLVPRTQPCAPCSITARCGNGKLEPGEICDGGSCCSSNCMRVTSTVACLSKFTYTTAAFDDSRGQIYIVQGDYYSRYTKFANYPTPDKGYPKPLNSSVILSVPSGWGQITATAAKDDGEIYIFSNFTYIIRDIGGSTITRPGQTGKADVDFALPPAFVSCGKIDAAVSLDNTYFLLFCDWTYVVVPFTRNADSVHPLQVESVLTLGITQLDLPITAVFGASDGTLYYFQGNQYTAIRARQVLAGFPKGVASVFTNSQALQTAKLPKQNCNDPNCANCPSSLDLCTVCEPLFVLHGSKCYEETVQAWVTFDLNAAEDSVFLKQNALARYRTLPTAQRNRWFQPGVRNESFVFDSQTFVELTPLALDSNPVREFEASMWYQPLGIHNGTWFEIDGQVRVDFHQHANNTFAITLFINDQPFECFVDTPITIGQWNKVEVRLVSGIFWTGANGIFHRRATIEYGGPATRVSLALNSWMIGSQKRPSIQGKMDEFVFRRLDVKATPAVSAVTTSTPTMSTAAIGAIVGASLFCCLICIIAGVYQFYCKPTYDGCPPCPCGSCCDSSQRHRNSLAYEAAPPDHSRPAASSEGKPQMKAPPPPVPGATSGRFTGGLPSRTGGFGGARPPPPKVPSYVR